MASLVRPLIIRYTLPSGRRCSPSTPGAIRTAVHSRKWYGQGIPGQPASKRFPLASNRTAAQRLLDNLVRNAERGQAGLPIESASSAKLEPLITRFEREVALGMVARGKKRRRPSPTRVRSVITMIRRTVADCGWKVAEDLNSGAGRFAEYLADRLALPRDAGGMSHQTATFYLSTAKRFAWWLSRLGLPVRAEVFDAIPGFDPTNERVHARRDLSPAEIGQLLTAARAGPKRGGLSGEDRYYLYLTAFASGFRAGELAALQPEHFELESTPPVLSLPHRHTKNKQAARQPIPPAVAMTLRPWIARKSHGRPVWPGTWRAEPGRMLQVDLRRAGIPYRVDTPSGPRFADFHSIRHSFVSALAATGVGPKELQELARHSDPRLTLSVYAHARPDALGEAIGRLTMPGIDSGVGQKDGLIASMSRAELEAAVALLAKLYAALVARPVAPKMAGPSLPLASVDGLTASRRPFSAEMKSQDCHAKQ
jgi:integrase